MTGKPLAEGLGDAYARGALATLPIAGGHYLGGKVRELAGRFELHLDPNALGANGGNIRLTSKSAQEELRRATEVKLKELGLKPDKNPDAANVAAHETYKDGLRAAMSKPTVSDPALARLIDPLYRPNATVGSGSTAAAVRQELASGRPVGGAFHSQKAEDSIRALERWLSNNPTALPGDRAAAENVIRDMTNALGGR